MNVCKAFGGIGMVQKLIAVILAIVAAIAAYAKVKTVLEKDLL